MTVHDGIEDVGAIDADRIRDAIQLADDAFWTAVADAFPEIKTGDFSVGETIMWGAACEAAVMTWLRNNAPDDETEARA